MKNRQDIERQLEERLAGLGYDLVQVIWAGSARWPVIRLRIERADLDRPVSVGDCALVSRRLEPWLDDEVEVEKYVLEVSSPGVERPLIRARDFERFRGHRVAVKGREPLRQGSSRLEGELLGLVESDDETGAILLRLAGGDEIRIPRSGVEGARLVYEWKRP